MSIAIDAIAEAGISAQQQKSLKTPRKRRLLALPDEQMAPEPR